MPPALKDADSSLQSASWGLRSELFAKEPSEPGH